MFRSLMPFGLALALAAATATPASAAGEKMSSQERMKSCNAEAGSKAMHGDARKIFMSSCLSGKTMDAADTTDSACSIQAGQKKLAGAARTSFLKKCLGS